MTKLKMTAYTFVLLGLVASPSFAKEMPGRDPKVWPGYETSNVSTRASRPNNEELEKRKEEFKENQEERKQKLEEFKAKRCEIANQNIDKVLERSEANRDKHNGFVSQFKENLDKLVTKLKEKGADTTKLEADLKVLGDKKSKLKTDYDAYIAKMKETRGFVCGESEGSFVESRKAARALFLVVRQDFEDIRNYFKDTIRPDIKALRESVKETSETEQENAQ